MGLLLLILASAVLGSFLTLLTQFLLLYRKQPEPPPDEAARAADGFRYIKPVPGLPLREYLYGGGGGGAEEPSGGPPEGGATPAPETPVPPTRETCYFLNAIILFLFRELRDTALARRWVTKKIKVEFEELLQTKTAGRLLEGLSLREVFLGETVPFIKTIRLLRPVAPSATGEPDGPEGEALPPATTPEELAFEAEVEYNGGFHLAIDVDLVFGKSAYLFVKLSRVVGRLRFVLTRVPFTHWFFSFVEDPLIDFEVRSQFEGRPLPQLTSFIVNQLKKIIKRKHTLPSYKIRIASGNGEGNGAPLQYSCLKTPWMEEPGRLQSMGQLSDFTFTNWKRKWQPTPVFLPGESQGWRSLVCCRLWDTTEVT